MIHFLGVLSIAHAIETVSYLTSGSELDLTGHSGVQFITDSMSCFLGIFNSSVPFALKCQDEYPLYIDDSRRTHLGIEVLTEGDLIFYTGLTVGSVDQWNLVHLDMFEGTEASTWSNKSVTECAGVRMLGGHCQYSAGNSSTTITLPSDHTQVKVKLTWHFIDQWKGESGFMSIGTSSSNTTVWSQTYDISLTKYPINMCGNEDYGEGKFSMPVEVVMDHSSTELVIILGTTLEEQPCEKSWGISGLEVYIR